MKRFLAPTVLVVCLAAPLAAVAKSVEAVEVCGEAACRSVPSSELHGHEAFDWVFGGGQGLIGDGPPASAPTWRANVTVGAGTDGSHSEVLRQIVAPSTGDIRLDSAWQEMSRQASRKWESLTRGLAPLPASSSARANADPANSAAGDSPSAGGAGDSTWIWVAAAGLGIVGGVTLWRRRPS
jgi:hypothetical protein